MKIKRIVTRAWREIKWAVRETFAAIDRRVHLDRYIRAAQAEAVESTIAVLVGDMGELDDWDEQSPAEQVAALKLIGLDDLADELDWALGQRIAA